MTTQLLASLPTSSWASSEQVDLSRTDLTGKEIQHSRPNQAVKLARSLVLLVPRCRLRSLQLHTSTCALVKPIPLPRLADATVLSCLPSYPVLSCPVPFLFLSCKSLARTGSGFTVHPSIPLRSGLHCLPQSTSLGRLPLHYFPSSPLPSLVDLSIALDLLNHPGPSPPQPPSLPCVAPDSTAATISSSADPSPYGLNPII